jgi:hypothetical protein
MSQPDWISTTARLPANGQTVLVKTLHGDVEHRMTFRAKPEPQWVSASLITPLKLYAYWRPAPSQRATPTHDAHAAL